MYILKHFETECLIKTAFYSFHHNPVIEGKVLMFGEHLIMF